MYCVYFLMDSHMKVQYCGMTSDHKRRTKEHSRRFPDLHLHVVEDHLTRQQALASEYHYIDRYKLVLNGWNYQAGVKGKQRRSRTKRGRSAPPVNEQQHHLF